jgi:hypothetical protein
MESAADKTTPRRVLRNPLTPHCRILPEPLPAYPFTVRCTNGLRKITRTLSDRVGLRAPYIIDLRFLTLGCILLVRPTFGRYCGDLFGLVSVFAISGVFIVQECSASPIQTRMHPNFLHHAYKRRCKRISCFSAPCSPRGTFRSFSLPVAHSLSFGHKVREMLNTSNDLADPLSLML